MENEETQGFIARMARAMMRRIFKNCQGKPVNKRSRQMTPEEAVEFQERMEAHGVQGRKGSSVNESPRRSGAGR